MIDIQFRECCQTCPNIDVSYDSTIGLREAITVIGCSHACVCAAYSTEESEKVPPHRYKSEGIPRC